MHAAESWPLCHAKNGKPCEPRLHLVICAAGREHMQIRLVGEGGGGEVVYDQLTHFGFEILFETKAR